MTAFPTQAFAPDQVIEQLNDLIFMHPDPVQAIQEQIRLICNTLDRRAAILFVQQASETFPYLTLEHQPPLSWHRSLNAENNEFLPIIRQTFETSAPVLFQIHGEPGIALPIPGIRFIQGVLCLTGAEITSHTPEALYWLLKSVGRCLIKLRERIQPQEYGKDQTTLQIIISAQDEQFVHDHAQKIILAGILSIFEGELAVLYTQDPENERLLDKKVIGTDGNWLFRTSSTLKEGLVKQCIEAGLPRWLTDTANSDLFNPSIDGLPGYETRSALCIPLMAQNQSLGVIEILNFHQQAITASDLRLVASLAASLSSSTLSNRLIEQLKVANADLEASRWELLNSRNILRALFDSIPASIYIVDRDLNLVAVNKSRVNRTEYKVNELISKKCYAALFGRAEPCSGCQVQDTLIQGRNTTRSEREWPASGDQPTEWEISTYPILDTLGAPIQAILLEQDVTEKRRLEANLVQSEKLAAVGQLAAGLAHEINNPLAAIIANAQLIGRSLPNGDDNKESAQLIETAGIRASQVVRNLLGFARKEKYSYSSVDVNETLKNALALLQHEIVTRSIEMTTEFDPSIPPVIGSKDHLQGVWVNLIVNAMDAIDHPNGKVHISTRFNGTEHLVSISDNGSGISADNLSHIFEPFYTTKAPGRGTGLGLSVCHRVIKQHGGHILVDSTLNIGTKFTVVLPIDPV